MKAHYSGSIPHSYVDWIYSNRFLLPTAGPGRPRGQGAARRPSGPGARAGEVRRGSGREDQGEFFQWSRTTAFCKPFGMWIALCPARCAGFLKSVDSKNRLCPCVRPCVRACVCTPFPYYDFATFWAKRLFWKSRILDEDTRFCGSFLIRKSTILDENTQFCGSFVGFVLFARRFFPN